MHSTAFFENIHASNNISFHEGSFSVLNANSKIFASHAALQSSCCKL